MINLPLIALIVAIFAFGISASVSAASVQPGYYLKWNTDHTERGLRPVYAIADEAIQSYWAYRIDVSAGRPSRVCYFRAGVASDHADFGAHCIDFSYSAQTIERHYVNVAGARIANAKGVFTERYLLNEHGFYYARQNLDAAGNLVEDSDGVAEYRFNRDDLGRRESERRLNKHGDVVPEHNGFLEACFAFDEHDYARYRKGCDGNGEPAAGPKGYAAAYFWFDRQGNFLKEEFRNLQGQPVPGPSGQFARIEYHDLDNLGNWHKAILYDGQGALLQNTGAVIRATYNRFHQRKSLTYFDAQNNKAANSQGVHQYQYHYDADGVLTARKAFSKTGRPIE